MMASSEKGSVTGELVSFEVSDDKVFGCHLAFADPRAVS